MNLKDFENKILKKSKSKKIPIFKTEFLDIPKGSIIELRGEHKSRIIPFSISLLNQIQNYNEVGLYVDADYSLDINLMSKEVLLMRPKNSQEVFDVLTQIPLLKSISMVVVSSVLNLLPLNGDYTQLKQNLIKLRKIIHKNKTSIIILNPYISNKYNMFSKYVDMIIVLKKIKTIKSKIQGEGRILKNNINLNCKKFKYII